MWENDPGHKTHLFVGRYKDGTKRYIRWGKQFRELPELIYDQQAAEVSPITASLKKMGGKTSPNVQVISQIFTAKTPSGFKNKELEESTGWKWVAAVGREIATSPIPFSLKNTYDETKEFHITDIMFPSSKGMTYYKSKRLFKAAILRNKPKAIDKIFIAATENNLAAYDILEDAIREIQGEARAELGRKIRLGTAKEEELSTLLGKEAMASETEREAIKQAAIERWELLLEAARERYRTYQAEKEMTEKEMQLEKQELLSR
jgi:hypothetical protein